LPQNYTINKSSGAICLDSLDGMAKIELHPSLLVVWITYLQILPTKVPIIEKSNVGNFSLQNEYQVIIKEILASSAKRPKKSSLGPSQISNSLTMGYKYRKMAKTYSIFNIPRR